MSNLLFCLISVKFRVNPWLILLLLPMPMLILNSVAMLLLILILPSVKFRVRPWQMLLFPSVSLLLSFPCFSVKFRGKFFCFFFSSLRG